MGKIGQAFEDLFLGGINKTNETKKEVIMTTTQHNENPVDLIAYATREYMDNRQKKTTFTRIGKPFPHKDGVGFTILLDALPIDGKIVILPALNDEADGDVSNSEG